ncbi:MAG: hypothetical protein A2149_02325 [Candidatus Schekmanbacteria bacterium RBG_16_38_11]|uniref:HTH merR-type domain-containing protein n=1 Tax=Candidatus Schekmanbacteria bacterium RBG_16_38_11 TaxID=1817880 RepID=A0A1F7S078_9BACT|nr:MAG: hypothetical protein A2149_02325 [Candidatus Schekmanbacteria bacterium RBG_16_38_11]
MDFQIPDKMFFKIGEVGRLAGLDTHVLRFWESEFKQLSPAKRKGQRVYQRKDVEMVFHIKKLLYEEGYTIAGAKKWLKQNFSPDKKEKKGRGGSENKEILLSVRKDLEYVLSMLKKKR